MTPAPLLGVLAAMSSRFALIGLLLLLTGASAGAADVGVQDRFFTASDGTRLHYLEAGDSRRNRVIVLVPGWTMPAWIWEAQIRAFSQRDRVIAFDPRGQGSSDAPAWGYEPIRRGKDIGELIAHIGAARVLLVAWSLGVLDSLAYVHTHGDSRLAGLVLVDNSVGEEPAPVSPPAARRTMQPKPPHFEVMRRFVHAMFNTRRDPDYLERLTQATMRTPEAAARKLLAYPLPRSYWKEAVYAATCPVLYVVRPRWVPQAENLALHRPGTETEIFTEAGHALFVDEPTRFNTIVESFSRRRVWP